MFHALTLALTRAYIYIWCLIFAVNILCRYSVSLKCTRTHVYAKNEAWNWKIGRQTHAPKIPRHPRGINEMCCVNTTNTAIEADADAESVFAISTNWPRCLFNIWITFPRMAEPWMGTQSIHNTRISARKRARGTQCVPHLPTVITGIISDYYNCERNEMKWNDVSVK